MSSLCVGWGDMYYQGVSGNDQNTTAVLPYWKMAADYGDDDIAGKVGVYFLSGTGCTKDVVLGVQYLKRSADIGNADAQYWVGLCFLDGVGVQSNYDLGKQYLRAAALQNHAQAQMDLSRALIREDNGFDEDVHWMCCAYLNGIEDASNGLEFLAENPRNAQAVQARIEYIQKHGVVPPANNSYSDDNASNKGGCYISTAVYGSYDSPQVVVLRKYRDNVLQKHLLGRLFIKTYYLISPPLAERLKKAASLNATVRVILDKIVLLIEKNITSR